MSISFAVAVVITVAVLGMQSYAAIFDTTPTHGQIMELVTTTTCDNSRIDPNGVLRHVYNPTRQTTDGNLSWIISLCILTSNTPMGTKGCATTPYYSAVFNSDNGTCLNVFNTVDSVVPAGTELIGGPNSILANITLNMSGGSTKLMIITKCIENEKHVIWGPYGGDETLLTIEVGHSNFCSSTTAPASPSGNTMAPTSPPGNDTAAPGTGPNSSSSGAGMWPVFVAVLSVVAALAL